MRISRVGSVTSGERVDLVERRRSAASLAGWVKTIDRTDHRRPPRPRCWNDRFDADALVAQGAGDVRQHARAIDAP